MFDPKMFVHIPKCAGMTIRRSDVLRGKIIPAVPQTHKSPEYTKALEEQMAKQGDHHGYEHARWRDLNWQYQAYDCFAVARKPLGSCRVSILLCPQGQVCREEGRRYGDQL